MTLGLRGDYKYFCHLGNKQTTNSFISSASFGNMEEVLKRKVIDGWPPRHKKYYNCKEVRYDFLNQESCSRSADFEWSRVGGSVPRQQYASDFFHVTIVACNKIELNVQGY